MTSNNLPIAGLRALLKGTGITLNVHQYSWGPHIKIRIDGKDTRSVMTGPQYDFQSKRLAPLAEAIKGKNVTTKEGCHIWGFEYLQNSEKEKTK